jgi:uncharacterized DUF497 family protein
VEIEFDADKDRINQEKHGISLSAAAYIDIDAAFIVPDRRRAYGETRSQAYCLIYGRLHMLAYTMRGAVLRVISLRRANSREANQYGEQVRRSR